MDLVHHDGVTYTNETKSIENLFILHLHHVSLGSVNFLVLDLDLPLDIRNF